jgi:hypothetical protein
LRRLAVTAAVCLGPWGADPECTEYPAWDRACPEDVPPVPGFIESSFNPLVYAAVSRLSDAGAIRPGEGTALLLGSLFGDATTNDLASRQMIQGKPDNPLLFYQSVVNSIVGYISREKGITGTTLCMSGYGNVASALLEQAGLLLASGDAEQVVVVGAEIAGSDKSDLLWSRGFHNGSAGTIVDAAAAFVIEDEAAVRAAQRPVLAVIESVRSGAEGTGVDADDGIYDPYDKLPRRLGGIQGLVGMAIAVNRLRSGTGAVRIRLTDYSMGGDLDVICLASPSAVDGEAARK